MARGALVISSIFLSSASIYLASEEADCLNDPGEVEDSGDGEAFVFRISSLVSNIAVISGVLAALFMLLVGAMVNPTKHRKNCI